MGVILSTYKEIQAYVSRKYGWTPKSCWIADAKEKCGLKVAPAPNRRGKDRANPCPENKFSAIREALEHFSMIKKP
jgi:hypothetical protein